MSVAPSALYADMRIGFCLVSGNSYIFSLYKGIVTFIFQTFCETCILMPVYVKMLHKSLKYTLKLQVLFRPSILQSPSR